MTLQDLLKLIVKSDDQKELLHLVDQYQHAAQTSSHIESSDSSAVDAQRQEALDKIMERVHWHFRAIRHPLPTKQELEEMIVQGMSTGERDGT
jgi:hypothetical protein